MLLININVDMTDWSIFWIASALVVIASFICDAIVEVKSKDKEYDEDDEDK